MALTVKHRFISPKGEQSDPSIIGPNEWNDSHVIVGGFPLVFSDDYNFTPQTPGGNLTAGVTNFVTLSPVPQGVSNLDTQHYLYINDGANSEAVLITGGNATPGAASGIIGFTPAHNHSGSWTISSNSSGIKEACNFLNGTGMVILPYNPISIKGAPLVIPTTLSLRGQGYSTSVDAGSIIHCDMGANPGIIVARSGGEASGQGIGIHADYTLQGPDSTTTTTIGLLLGGDPNGVFTPAIWYGSYVRFYNVFVYNFGITLKVQRAYFIIFVSCVFSGNSRALLFPSGALGLQPGEFYGCVMTVPSGPVIQMDTSNFQTSSIMYFGGQISGTVVGNDLYLESYGTHYEPNAVNDPVLDAVNTLFVAHGGICSVHGPSAPYMFRARADHSTVTLKDCSIQCDSGTTVPYLVKFDSSSGGLLTIANINIYAAGIFTNWYSVNPAAAPAIYLSVNINALSIPIAVNITGSTVVLPISNFPFDSRVILNGGTVGGGITAVTGFMQQGQCGLLRTSAIQNFVAGATIGANFTSVAFVPFNYYFDGTKVWFS